MVKRLERVRFRVQNHVVDRARARVWHRVQTLVVWARIVARVNRVEGVQR